MYYPHAVIFPGGNVISQLTDLSGARNFADLAERSPSDIGPTFTGSQQSTPDINFGTQEVKTLLDLMTLQGICDDFSGGNVDVEYRAGKNRGDREDTTDTDHLRLRCESNAYASWQSLKVDQGSNAEIRARVVPVYDGVNNPMVAASGVALSVSNPAVSQLYTQGPIKINGTTLDLVQGSSWENNIEYDEQVGDEGFYVWSGIRAFAPMITIRTRKSSYYAAYGEKGTALTSLTLYLRRRQRNGMNEPNGSAVHIAFTHTAGTIKARTLGNTGEVEIGIQLEKAAGVWFTKNTASTIS
jgi:hypothetical protein